MEFLSAEAQRKGDGKEKSIGIRLVFHCGKFCTAYNAHTQVELVEDRSCCEHGISPHGLEISSSLSSARRTKEKISYYAFVG
jgi:hypothetical protein